VQVIGNGLDVDVALEAEMADRNQGCVFDAGKADLPRVTVAHGLVPRHERKHVMHEAAKVAVGAAGQEFRTRHGQRN
jgi:hypothetical protein